MNAIKGIKYVGPVHDSSGYAEAGRNYIAALHSNNIPIAVQAVSFEKEKVHHGVIGKIVSGLVDKKINYNIKITHLTPEHYPIYKEPNVFNIGYTVWETTKIPKVWVGYCNQMDAIIVPCDWNIGIFKDCGVTVPIKKVCHGVDTKEFAPFVGTKPLLPNAKKDTFIFYSIFQWTERKNPIGTLKAYLTEFTEKDNVLFVLKTYGSNTSQAEQNKIIQQIKQLKLDLNLKYYPPISFIGNLLTRNEIIGIHSGGDVYVQLQRSEGFGCPHLEALSMGNPIISTGMGGNMEFMNEQNSWPVNYQWTPVGGMSWIPWYNGHQEWAEPDIVHAKRCMREAYSDRKITLQKGIEARKNSVENFSWEVIGKQMINTINELINERRT